MGLPRSLSFLRTGTGGQTLEVYLDPLCPFSRKGLNSLHDNVVPHISKGGKYEGQLQLIIRVYAQPFHFFSSYPSEALLVFGREYPDLFWDIIIAVFAIQEQFYNRAAFTKTPQEAIAAYVGEAVKVVEKHDRLEGQTADSVAQSLTEKLLVRGGENKGSDAFDDFKYLIREGRQNGIHVTPTVLLNGLEDPSISSSWGATEWDKYLKEKLE